jgi:excisionase family DNA binding protein
MARTNQTIVEQPRQEPTKREPDTRKNAPEQSENHVLLPCILLLSPNAVPILRLLQNAVAGPPPSASPESPMQSIRSTQRHGDSWLAHSEAAEYLGVARSTLYHYVCEKRIESRKIGGRLEYRLSALDKFKDEQVRPARRSPHARSIIVAAHCSGK